MLFELKCVFLAVCVQKHPITIKIHPVLFFKIQTLFSYQAIHIFLAELCSSTQAPHTIVDWQWHRSLVLAQTRPEWAVISPPLFRRWSGCGQEWLLSDWGVLLERITLDFEGNVPPNLPKWVYVCANHLWFLWIFPNNALVSKIHGWMRLKFTVSWEQLVAPQKRGAGWAEYISI